MAIIFVLVASVLMACFLFYTKINFSGGSPNKVVFSFVRSVMDVFGYTTSNVGKRSVVWRKSGRSIKTTAVADAYAVIAMRAIKVISVICASITGFDILGYSALFI